MDYTGGMSSDYDPDSTVQTSQGRKANGGKRGKEITSKEEKDFLDQSTKKNLLNVKSKLDRAMNDLSKQALPLILMNAQSSSKDRTRGSFDNSFSGSNADGRILPDENALGSRMSSKRRSSFGSDDSAIKTAGRMAQQSQKLGKQDAKDKVFNHMQIELIMRKQQKTEHPLVAKNLRELIMVDDRLDSEEMNDKMFKPGTSGPVDYQAIAAQKQKNREEQQRIAELAKSKKAKRNAAKINKEAGVSSRYDDESSEDDSDGNGSDDDGDGNYRNKNGMAPKSPRMRHIRSYRCSTAKELNEFRMDMKPKSKQVGELGVPETRLGGMFTSLRRGSKDLGNKLTS